LSKNAAGLPKSSFKVYAAWATPERAHRSNPRVAMNQTGAIVEINIDVVERIVDGL
jgi:hypothetical protein